MDSKKSPLVEFLFGYLESDPDAQIFIYSWLLYCHAIDDIVDGDKTDSEHVIKTFQFATTLHTCNFFLRHWAILAPIIDVTFNAYADSVAMEKSTQDWERKYSDVLRQNGNEVISTVVGIVAGQEARRFVSRELRKFSYIQHHDNVGNPI